MHIRRESAVTGLFRKAAAFALLCAFIGGSPAVHAQAVNGSIYGSAQAGSTVTITNTGSGLKRDTTVGEDGKFSFSTLSPGRYTVSVSGKGLAPESRTAEVRAGIGTSVTFGDQLEEVLVLGTSTISIDTSTAQVSTSFSAEALAEMPKSLNVVSVALLAPGVNRGDTGLGSGSRVVAANLPAIGGSSVAENNYYINGFNVTNLFQNLNYSRLPFFALANEQVITGGYGPEFGLSTGGVVNLTAKKGTNDWQAGASATFEPDGMRSHSPTTFTPDGTPYRDYSRNTHASTTTDLWVGGPIVKDKLFVFALGEFTKETQTIYPVSYPGGALPTDIVEKDPYWMVDLAWNINDRNLLELTAINDRHRALDSAYSNDQLDSRGFVLKGSFLGTNYNMYGGNTDILKYTGYVTDDLTLTAQYGQLRNDSGIYTIDPNGTKISYNGVVGDFNQPGCPLTLADPSWTGAAIPGCWSSTTNSSSGSYDTRKAGRFDIEYKLHTPFGLNTLKLGVDRDIWHSNKYGDSYSGGAYYRYYSTTTGLNDISGNHYDYVGDYVRVRHFQTSSNAGVFTRGLYLKDDWQVTSNLLLQLGVRSDSFKNSNSNDITYVKQDNIIQPRLGFAWNVDGTSTKKLYGSYGIYSSPIAATVAIRGAALSLFGADFYRFTAIDPITGAPTLGAPISSPIPQYYNGENGQTVPNPDSVASKTLDPTIEEEFILGYQMQFNNGLIAGVRGTYRNLKKTIDDICDTRPFENWAADHGVTNVDLSNLPGCFLFNPGYAMDINADITATGVPTYMHITPAEIGMPKAMRRYVALDFTLEKKWSSKWYTRVAYTWSHNYGNAEGLVDSDNQQEDTGTTVNFDFPELQVGSSGNLPNDRRHSVKGQVSYRPSTSWVISTNLLAQSGRPKNCIGNAPFDPYGYDAAFFYCNGKVTPRGSLGFLPWQYDVDVAVTYSPERIQGLSLQASVFNLFNGSTKTQVIEDGEIGGQPGVADPRFGTPRSYQAPFYVQLNAKYEFNFGKH